MEWFAVRNAEAVVVHFELLRDFHLRSMICMMQMMFNHHSSSGFQHGSGEIKRFRHQCAAMSAIVPHVRRLRSALLPKKEKATRKTRSVNAIGSSFFPPKVCLFSVKSAPAIGLPIAYRSQNAIGRWFGRSIRRKNLPIVVKNSFGKCFW